MGKYRPPKCPNCEEPLESVYENVYETWCFDPKTGTYSENPHVCDMEIRCPNCNAKLWDVFPEGACNYQAPEALRVKT